MTEQEWLASEDPIAMLTHLRVIYEPGPVSEPGVVPMPLISDRKLKLFATNCAVLSGYPMAVVDDVAGTNEREGSLDRWARSWASRVPGTASACVPQLIKASILRDIMGNPFRPVDLPLTMPCPVCDAGMAEGRVCCSCCQNEGFLCPLLTPTVLSLAQAACEETLPNAVLDPVRLAVLADALEEAGADGGEPCACDGGWLTSSQGERVRRYRCDVCKGRGRIDRLHPLVAHLRSQNLHVEGCWALDLVLGKER
jgi:hypothetical protein